MVFESFPNPTTMGEAMIVKFYRDARHPEMLFEIRTRLEDLGVDIRLTETVADLLNAGMPIERAIPALRAAITPGAFTTNEG